MTESAVVTAITTGSVNIELREVRLPIGLVAESIHVTGQDVVFRSQPIDIQAATPASVNIRITLAALAEYLETQQMGGLKGFRCEAADGALVIHATKKVIIDVPAKATCRLVIRDQSELWVQLESAEAMGGASVKNLVQSQLEKSNPVFSVTDLPVRVELLGVQVLESGVEIEARLRPFISG